MCHTAPGPPPKSYLKVKSRKVIGINPGRHRALIIQLWYIVSIYTIFVYYFGNSETVQILNG